MEAVPVVTLLTLILSANPILALLVAASISTVTLVSALLKPSVPPCLIFTLFPLSSVKLIPLAISVLLALVCVIFAFNASLVACNWLPLIASVDVALIRPAATLVMVRWVSVVLSPTDTTPSVVPPAKLYVFPPNVTFATLSTSNCPPTVLILEPAPKRIVRSDATVEPTAELAPL